MAALRAGLPADSAAQQYGFSDERSAATTEGETVWCETTDALADVRERRASSGLDWTLGDVNFR